MLRFPLYLWAFPTTVLGLPFLLAALFDGQVRLVEGVLEIHGRTTTWWLIRVAGIFLPGGASAMTLGHIVLGRDPAALERTRIHERVHVRQCEWFGPFFLVAYVLASLAILLAGGDPYRQNPFERQAYDRDRRRSE